MGVREVNWARRTRGGTSGIAVVCVGRVGVLLIAGAIGVMRAVIAARSAHVCSSTAL